MLVSGREFCIFSFCCQRDITSFIAIWMLSAVCLSGMNNTTAQRKHKLVTIFMKLSTAALVRNRLIWHEAARLNIDSLTIPRSVPEQYTYRFPSYGPWGVRV